MTPLLVSTPLFRAELVCILIHARTTVSMFVFVSPFSQHK